MLTSGVEIKVAPSILAADFSRLGEQVAEASNGGADYLSLIHISEPTRPY